MENRKFMDALSAFSATYMKKPAIEAVLLPPGALKRLTQFNVMFPMFFRISTAKTKRKVFCGVLEFVAEENTCCLPDWVMKQLEIEDGDNVMVVNVKLPKGNFMKIQPFETKFTELHNPKAIFEHALLSYACLAVNDVITISHGGEDYRFQILECKPEPAIGVIDTDITLEFAQAKDYDPNKKPVTEKTQEVKKKDKFPGVGVQVVGKKKRLVPFQNIEEEKESVFDPRANRISYYKVETVGNKKGFEAFKGKAICLKDTKKFKAYD